MPNPFFADLVRELCHEGGTGPLTPTDAAPGHRRFADTVPVGAPFHYAVAGVAWPAEWENGTGHIDEAGRLVRESVTASSNGGAHVDFAPGLKTIALTVGAAWFAGQQADTAATAEALAGKQPLSTGHASAANGAGNDMLTVRRGESWVNIPLSSLAYRDGTGWLQAGAPLACADGAAASPSIAFGSDTDTGLYRVGANGLGFVTGGIERARIDAGGNLAIGTNVGAGIRLHARAAASDSTTYIARFDTTNVAGNDIHGLWVSANAADNMTYLHSTGSSAGGFGFITGNIGTAAAVTIATNGNIGIGTATPPGGARLDAVGGSYLLHTTTIADMTNKSGRFATRAYDAGRIVEGVNIITQASANMVYLGGGAGVGDAATAIRFITAPAVNTPTGTTRWELTSSRFTPFADNAYDCGSASLRVKDLFLANNPTVTSDAREKTWRGAPTPAEIAASRRIVAELGFFQWNDAIAEKGPDGARRHFGVRAQAVWAVMADEGLICPLDDAADPSSRYAFLCWDGWDAREEDESGPARAAGDRFGLRVDQLALFLIAAQEARLAALEGAA